MTDGPMATQSSSYTAPRQWENRYEISNRLALTCDYRLLEIQGLPPGEHFDKNLNQLLKQVRYELKQPVALVRRGDIRYLAIPADSALPRQEQRLIPHAVHLVFDQDVHPLSLASLDLATTPIALAFLQFALRRPLWGHQRLWDDGNSCFEKRALNAQDSGATIDIYPGFGWSVEAEDDGRLFLSLEVRNRYVDRLWLPERLARGGKTVEDVFLRRCLYHFGDQWFIVQLRHPTGKSVGEQRFVLEDTQEIVGLLDYTREKCGPSAPRWISELDPDSPAVMYRYPGNEKERHGALALCKCTYTTQEGEAAGLHRRSISNPGARFRRTGQIVGTYFQQASLGGQRIRIEAAPRDKERRIFAVPPMRFGHDRVLAVTPVSSSRPAPRPDTSVTDLVPLEELGRRRMQLMLSPQAGPLDVTPFDPQYLVMPYSVPRKVGDDFEQKFVAAMRQVSGQPTYNIRRIMYQDRGATSLVKQLKAIRDPLELNGHGRGFILLVLPPRAHPKLHHQIKAALWRDIQVQCARAEAVLGFYQPVEGGQQYRVVQGRESKYASYVRNCALAMLAVNRKWPWALAAPLHYDVYVGIDVLNHRVGATFVYNDARQIYFRDFPSTQPERLTSRQMREIIAGQLSADLKALKLRPRSLVVHRDGRALSSEPVGLRKAVEDLQREGLLPLDVTVGMVDVRKTMGVPARIVEGVRLEEVENPTIGSFRVYTSRSGVVCTTGWPFSFPGTAQPLMLVISEGNLNIEWVLEDAFALSQEVFTAPDRCARLPVTIKLADDLLEPIAGAEEDDEALYDEGAEPEESVPVVGDGTRVDAA